MFPRLLPVQSFDFDFNQRTNVIYRIFDTEKFCREIKFTWWSSEEWEFRYPFAGNWKTTGLLSGRNYFRFHSHEIHVYFAWKRIRFRLDSVCTSYSIQLSATACSYELFFFFFFKHASGVFAAITNTRERVKRCSLRKTLKARTQAFSQVTLARCR